MTKDPFLVVMKQVTEIGDELEKLYTKVEELKILENLSRIRGMQDDVSLWFCSSVTGYSEDIFERELRYLCMLINTCTLKMTIFCSLNLTSLVSKEEESLRIGGRRVADAIVVSAGNLLSLFYLYLIGYIDRGGSKAGSSGSLDFRDIYISIVLFQAAYIWIKFRDVIPRGAVYHRPNSNKFEPRIKFPVTRGVGGKSKRIPLGLYDTLAEGEVAYQIAAFYCDKPRHTGRLDLGGGAYFPIPALSVDSNLPYEDKVKQVGDRVLKVYAEFEERKASRIVPPSIPRPAFEMSNGEDQLSVTSPIQQLRQPLNSGMDSTMHCQGSEHGPNTHNGVDFTTPFSLLPVLAETQYKLLDAHKQIECLKAQVTRMEVENMRWEIKYSELERENGLLNHQITQSPLQTQHEELELDPDIFSSMGNGKSPMSDKVRRNRRRTEQSQILRKNEEWKPRRD